ncbi:TetR family transcriptional regulator [Paenibacillus glucanolyticus]|uniref:TetR/AcrR family transcriptional regulator n=1 Tax=Paenibacillus glucanolyticus TaxID=59843 RepID=UPI000D1C068B|nr:TetR/AcrR family transcriptional regulator [Paenibacillus glucanolyticus]AVV56275.1 TetR family transcriptional regulator [Paenibacillus glucanolyticus]
MGKREDILDATLELITEEGLQSLTFSKIFKKANVGSSTVYHYFQSKEELVSELFRTLRMHMGETIMKGYDPGLTIYQRTKAILKNTANYALHFTNEQAFIENYCQSPFIFEEIRTMPDPAINEIFAIIEEGQQHGIIRELDKVYCCQLVSGMITSVIKGYLAGKYPLHETLIQETIDACWRAIKV